MLLSNRNELKYISALHNRRQWVSHFVAVLIVKERTMMCGDLSTYDVVSMKFSSCLEQNQQLVTDMNYCRLAFWILEHWRLDFPGASRSTSAD